LLYPTPLSVPKLIMDCEWSKISSVLWIDCGAKKSQVLWWSMPWTYNNLQYLEANSTIKLVNRILKKNFSILSSLNTNGKTSVRKIHLQNLGYRFEHFTSISKTRSKDVYFYCYNQGYTELNDKMIMLVLPFKNDNLA